MKFKTKYSPNDHVEVNGKGYEILSVLTRSVNFGIGNKCYTDTKYHVQGTKGQGCTILEEMITKKLKNKFNLG